MKPALLLPLLLPLLPIVASGQDAALSGAGLEMTLREVADLLEPYRPPGVEDVEPPDPELLRAQASYLESFLVRNVEPPIRTEARRVAVNGTTLITFLDPAQEAWIERFLERQREAAGTLFDVTCRFLTLDPELAEALGTRGEPRVLATGELETLLNAAAAGDGAEVLSAPRLLAGRMQQSTIAVTTPRVFVEGWDEYEHVEPGGRSLVVPRVRTVDEGVTLSCRVTPLADGLLAVDFGATLSEVGEPVEVRATPRGEVAAPVVTTRTVDSAVRVGSGDTLLFSGLSTESREVVVLLRVAEVRAEPAPPGAIPAAPADGSRRAADRR